jgi:hypothetical protein
MAIKQFTFDQALIHKFLRFGYELYRGDTQWVPPLKKNLRRQLAPTFPFYARLGNAHQHFLAFSNGRVVGRITAFVNRDLRDSDETPIGTLGFFECRDDFAAAEDLVSASSAWLNENHGVKRVWGPMNFDIWNNYRFMTKGFDQRLFFGEPYNKAYYPGFFLRCGFVPRYRWDSVEITGRQALDHMISRGSKRYKLLVDRGYRFERFQVDRVDDKVRQMHQILCNSFAKFPGFTAIPLSDFARLFEQSRWALDPRFCVFVYNDKNNLAGFAAALLDLADAIRVMGGRDHIAARLRFLYQRRRVDRINFYIGAATPEEVSRRSGLGRAGFYYIINQIIEAGYETVLLTLRQVGNQVRALQGANKTKPQREYTLFEFNR